MGCAQSTETNYYLGFINVSISHMDLFSFFLGICVTVGMLYIIRCIRTNRKLHRHILGGHPWGPYPMPPMATSYSNTPPTAPPYQASTKTPVAIPWQISWNSKYLQHVILSTAFFGNKINSNFRFAKPDELREKIQRVCNLHVYNLTFKNFILWFWIWFMISILAFHMETHVHIFTIQINYDIFGSDFYDILF